MEEIWVSVNAGLSIMRSVENESQIREVNEEVLKKIIEFGIFIY